ncbi:MAG: L-threonylcarbamoyladenylate synthase [Alphaproteobacteria bacterium]
MDGTTMIRPEPATEAAIARAADVLAAGGLVAFPTETVYGLGADATSDAAVARIFEAKARPRFNPLIAHVADAASAFALVAPNRPARKLADRFWPGPLTLLLRRLPGCPVSLLATAGLDTLAVRVPAAPVALALLEAFGGPVAAPSANPAGRLSPTTAAHVAEGLGERVDMILDGGPCRVGVESTIVDLTEPDRPLLLRPGGLARSAIEAVVGPLGAKGGGASPTAPGQLESHYAPARPVRLEATAPAAGEAWLGFGPGCAGADLNLSPSGATTEAAANLFAMLRALDRPPFAAIAVAPVPAHGLGEAINDRLRRAAAPRASAGAA